LAQQGSELDENSFGSSINTGILFLIAIPYLILMFFFRKQIARLFKRKKA
jgi:Na+-driven multidrug efflux pump